MPKKSPIGRVAKPFDLVNAAHTVVRVAEHLKWDMRDTAAFLARAQHVEYGLSAEIEFATILRWLGVCKFVHRLNDDVLADGLFDGYEVPDLFALFQHGTHRQSALIEVKTSEDMHLDFSKAYLDKLTHYAAQLGQPLLIAWRPRQIGAWLLFDPQPLPVEEGRVRITLDYAMRNDLMGLLAGDVCFIPMEGSGLRIVAERIGEKTPTPEGFQAMFTVTKAGFHDPQGNNHDVSAALSWLILSTIHYYEEVSDDKFVQSYRCEEFTKAQIVLRTAVGFSLSKDERIHWKAVHEGLNDILTCDGLVADAGAAFGTFVKYILYQQPQTRPEFLRDWGSPRLPTDT